MSEKFSSIAWQDYTLYIYMYESHQEFYVNFHNVKIFNSVEPYSVKRHFISHKLKSSVCLRKSIGL